MGIDSGKEGRWSWSLVTKKIQVKSEISESFGLVMAWGCTIEPAQESLSQALEAAQKSLLEGEQWTQRQKAVRDLLRHGKYKPTGRGKPASEYLRRAAEQENFPAINNLVDINNLLSLQTGLPISMFDVKASGEDSFLIRRGHEGETYVFNKTGQEIGLHDLLLIARAEGDQACANPVKDSQATKLNEQTQDVLVIIWGPAQLNYLVEECTASMEKWFSWQAKPSAIKSAVISEGEVSFEA